MFQSLAPFGLASQKVTRTSHLQPKDAGDQEIVSIRDLVASQFSQETPSMSQFVTGDGSLQQIDAEAHEENDSMHDLVSSQLSQHTSRYSTTSVEEQIGLVMGKAALRNQSQCMDNHTRLRKHRKLTLEDLPHPSTLRHNGKTRTMRKKVRNQGSNLTHHIQQIHQKQAYRLLRPPVKGARAVRCNDSDGMPSVSCSYSHFDDTMDNMLDTPMKEWPFTDYKRDTIASPTVNLLHEQPQATSTPTPHSFVTHKSQQEEVPWRSPPAKRVFDQECLWDTKQAYFTGRTDGYSKPYMASGRVTRDILPCSVTNHSDAGGITPTLHSNSYNETDICRNERLYNITGDYRGRDSTEQDVSNIGCMTAYVPLDRPLFSPPLSANEVPLDRPLFSPLLSAEEKLLDDECIYSHQLYPGSGAGPPQSAKFSPKLWPKERYFEE